jgi:hypothetical protein
VAAESPNLTPRRGPNSGAFSESQVTHDRCLATRARQRHHRAAALLPLQQNCCGRTASPFNSGLGTVSQTSRVTPLGWTQQSKSPVTCPKERSLVTCPKERDPHSSVNRALEQQWLLRRHAGPARDWRASGGRVPIHGHPPPAQEHQHSPAAAAVGAGGCGASVALAGLAGANRQQRPQPGPLKRKVRLRPCAARDACERPPVNENLRIPRSFRNASALYESWNSNYGSLKSTFSSKFLVF